MATKPETPNPTPAAVVATEPAAPAPPAKGRRALATIRAELAQAKESQVLVERASMSEWRHMREMEKAWNEAQAHQRSRINVLNPFMQPIVTPKPSPTRAMNARTALLHSLTVQVVSLDDELRGYTLAEQAAAERDGVFAAADFDYSECNKLDPPKPEPPGGYEAEQQKLLGKVNRRWAELNATATATA
jgi:hypothetical protein